jgi:hypothetical protein
VPEESQTAHHVTDDWSREKKVCDMDPGTQKRALVPQYLGEEFLSSLPYVAEGQDHFGVPRLDFAGKMMGCLLGGRHMFSGQLDHARCAAGWSGCIRREAEEFLGVPRIHRFGKGISERWPPLLKGPEICVVMLQNNRKVSRRYRASATQIEVLCMIPQTGARQ